jgi:hypothetical protein
MATLSPHTLTPLVAMMKLFHARTPFLPTLLVLGLLCLGGCSADGLVGPEEQEQVTNNGNGGSTDPIVGENSSEDDENPGDPTTD